LKEGAGVLQRPESRLNSLHNRHLGETCVLVCNGPSLNQMNLSFLRRQVCIGLNKIFLGIRTFKFYPRYYVAVNQKVIAQSASEIRALNAVKLIGSKGHSIVAEDALTYHLNTSSPPGRFSKDLAQGAHEGWTVTHVALQVAYYLGFHKVVIIGMDHRYAFSGLANQASLLQGPDPNHFSAEYFSGQVWDNPDLARSEESYRIAREVFEANGRRILDATVNGACTIFEKVDYREHFGVVAA
jgi:hypothetical protein